MDGEEKVHAKVNYFTEILNWDGPKLTINHVRDQTLLTGLIMIIVLLEKSQDLCPLHVSVQLRRVHTQKNQK